MKFWLLRTRALIFCCLMLFGMVSAQAFDMGTIPVRELPPEAQQTLSLIKQGGPFPYTRDGIVFGNYQHALPSHPRGYYHEYTVKTPGAHNRGAQRIIVGGDAPGSEYFYTNDHYATFQRIQE